MRRGGFCRAYHAKRKFSKKRGMQKNTFGPTYHANRVFAEKRGMRRGGFCRAYHANRQFSKKRGRQKSTFGPTYHANRVFAEKRGMRRGTALLDIPRKSQKFKKTWQVPAHALPDLPRKFAFSQKTWQPPLPRPQNVATSATLPEIRRKTAEKLPRNLQISNTFPVSSAVSRPSRTSSSQPNAIRPVQCPE